MNRYIIDKHLPELNEFLERLQALSERRRAFIDMSSDLSFDVDNEKKLKLYQQLKEEIKKETDNSRVADLQKAHNNIEFLIRADNIRNEDFINVRSELTGEE